MLKQSALFVAAFLSIIIETNAQRIITAGSANTETVCALGLCDNIIASDKTSLYPAHIQQLPSIGYRTGISAEGIISMKPTLVIADEDYVDDAVVTQLRDADVKLVLVDRQHSLEGALQAITEIAQALGKEKEGERLIGKIKTDLSDAKTLLGKVTTQPKVVCVYNRGTGAISAAGRDTFANILQYVGATNAFPTIEGYKPLNTEALIAANPEYYVLLESGFLSIGGIEGFIKVPGVAQTSGGQKKNIIAIEGIKLTNFGPRFGEAVKELVIKLHPELQAK
ncbi:MAG: heme/hemin ABC transporter substrate-binding protein [Bacteroidota bacterium]